MEVVEKEFKDGSSSAAKQDAVVNGNDIPTGVNGRGENGLPPVTGTNSQPHDEDIEAELSSPPDSSSVSSVNPDLLGDEIIVGMHNGRRASSAKDNSDHDEDMADIEDSEPVLPQSSRKRKRQSLYAHLNEDNLEGDSELKQDDEVEAEPEAEAEADIAEPVPNHRRSNEDKGVIVGYWRESPVPDAEGKHAVIGFQDTRDRLRTRLISRSRSGGLVNARLYALPPGPGGRWVTFDRIVFDDHLVGLNHHEVKEYVKIRSDNYSPKETPEQTERLNAAAVQEAKRTVREHPPPETSAPLLTAYGEHIPQHAQMTTRSSEVKRRRTGSVAELPGGPRGQQPTPTGTPTGPSRMELKEITRPTRILVGCWSKSEAPRDEDKLAVYGILGANDMFRVKLVRETMDGRFTEQGFPAGAGALWVQYEEVTFLKHIQHLSRPEMKEYIRVRQSQIDSGETASERAVNEVEAAAEAQRRVANGGRTPVAASLAPRQPVHQQIASANGDDRPELSRSQSRRTVAPASEGRPVRHALPESPMGYNSARTQDSDRFERQRGIVGRQMDRMEAAQARDERHNMSRASIGQAETPPQNARQDLNANLQRMQRVWEAQEETRMKGNEDVKVYMGVKYERKKNGPFVDKLVSQGQIISIDGEDYVEYRVLTKPSFF